MRIWAQEYEKRAQLMSLLRRIMDGSKILVFAETKRGDFSVIESTISRALRFSCCLGISTRILRSSGFSSIAQLLQADAFVFSVQFSPDACLWDVVCLGADNLTRDLRMEGWPALSLHGDKKQEERTWVLDEFKQGRNPIMVRS